MSAPVPTTIDGLPTLTINALNAYSGSVDGSNDLLAIYQNSSTSTVNVTRNTYLNISSNPVGISDSQTLTNKTLTSPTISGPTLSGTIIGTYTIGGTPTFPSSVVTLTGSQTLTNKTLTSPTINAPTITNATISTDAITGFTVSNSGTIFGITVATGTITTANSVSGGALTSNSIPTGVLETNSVSAANLATNAITLGYAQITTNFVLSSSQTTPTQITSLTAPVTIPPGSRKVRITGFCSSLTLAGGVGVFTIWDGTVNSGTQLAQANVSSSTGFGFVQVVISPAAGSKTYNLGISNSGSNNTTVGAAATQPAFILVEVI